MSTSRRSTALAVTATVVALVTACAPSVPTTAGLRVHATVVPSLVAGDDGMNVAVLDLSGVDTSALATLPAPEDVPLDGEQQTRTTFLGGGVLAAASRVPARTTGTNRTDGTRPDPDVLTRRMATAPFSVLGLTWDQETNLMDVVIRYRVRVDGAWTRWQGVEASDVAPDPTSADAEHSGSRGGTDAIVAVGADGLQVWAESGTGTVHHLKAVLVDPGQGGASSDAATTTDDGPAIVRPAVSVRAAAMTQPTIHSRGEWGADESLRTCTPDYSTSMVSAAVHHTASTNSYSEADVPGLIRGFYAYHTRAETAGGRGWCDIGYNFLVDRFGRIWEGRADSAATTVIGVHTGGFNSRTVGVAAIGDYSTVAPSSALVEGLSQIIAWRFTVLGILAGTSVTMTSGGGASKYPEGTVVSFPTIYGHRDAQLTSCPGQALYDHLPTIRTRVAQLANASVAASPQGSIDRLTGTLTGVSTAGWAYDQDHSEAVTVAVTVDGTTVSVTADGARPDVGAAFGIGPNHGFDAQITTGGGQHLVCLTARNLGDGHDVQLGCRTVTVTNHDPIGSLDAAVAVSPTTLLVGGWAVDPDTAAPIGVHVYIDGQLAGASQADGPRPDVGTAYGKGDNHGFTQIYVVPSGTHQVCAYAINTPTGPNPQLGCANVAVTNRTPIGSLDVVAAASPTVVTVGGWVLDPDTAAPIGVHVYIDGQLAGASQADGPRPDVGTAYGKGDNHGFTQQYATTPGTHAVCAYAINVPTGPNPGFCATVILVNHNPFGSLDFATATSAASIDVTGWALDPDTVAPISVHAYVDGQFASAFDAGDFRPDVEQVFRSGDRHGFHQSIATTPGTHQVCLYAINTPTGGNPQIACRTVTTA